MPSLSVYLGLLDIDIKGHLELRSNLGEAQQNDILKYLFCYALIAQEVCMQGSAPLKNQNVFLAYRRLSEAFLRNEAHEEKPIFSFVLSSESESYLNYIVERLSFLRNRDKENTELTTYINNDAAKVASFLDKNINVNHVKKRVKSVSKEYKSSLSLVLNSGSFIEHGIKDEVAKKTINLLTNEEIIQTHHLLKSLDLNEIEQINCLYRVARDRYRKANAFGSNSINSETKPHFLWSNVWRYLNGIGLTPILNNNRALTCSTLFKLRNSKYLKELNNIYYECQHQEDINILLELISRPRINYNLKSIIKESNKILIPYIFEAISKSEVAPKPLVKGMELIVTRYMTDTVNEILAKKIFLVHGLMENLSNEIKNLPCH